MESMKKRECEQSFVLIGQPYLSPQIKHETNVSRQKMQFISLVIHQIVI